MLRVRECVRRVLLLVVCIGYAIGYHSAAIKVKGISSITVQRGHAIAIAASTYKIIYQTNKYDDCLVYVTSTSTFSCGTLSPDVFNYSNRPDLLYTHYGCEKDSEQIDLAISVISLDQNVFTTEYFTIEVKVKNVSNPILQLPDKIIVPADTQKASVSLKLSDDLECEYAIVSPMKLPYYGTVSGPIEQWLACSVHRSLEYTLVHQQWYQPEDRIIIAVRYNGSVFYEQIPVIISGSNDKVTSCMLERGLLFTTFNTYTPVGIESLIAQNCSLPKDWKFHITKGEQTAISLVTSYGRYLDTATFTFEQLEEGLVIHHRKSLKLTEQTYQYTLHDVYGRKIFNSSIVTKSTPLAKQHVEVSLNTGIDVVEGGSVVVTSKVLEFNAISPNCTNFTINLVVPPRHGHFKSALTNATLSELNMPNDHNLNMIVFQHSDYNNFGDRAVWEVQCLGINIGRFLQPIRVIVKDDTPPYLHKSTISMYADSIIQFSQFLLQASDVDSSDATIKYDILSVDAGQFYYGSREDVFNNRGAKVTQFHQKDIDNGNIWYRLLGDANVLLNISDESLPPNVLPSQNLTINILIPYKMTLSEAPLKPDKLSKIPVVEIAGKITLSFVHFSYFTEQFVSNSSLEISIIDRPQSGSVIPDIFTLGLLKDNGVIYSHKGVSHDCNDSFIFQMRNITGARVFGKIIVSVVEQRNTSHHLSLKANLIHLSILRPTFPADSIVITDAPVCPDHILFVIESLPEFGRLRLRRWLEIGSSFSLKQLKDGLLSYYSVVDSDHVYIDGFNFSLHSPIGNLTANSQYSNLIYNSLDPMVSLHHPSTLYRCSETEFSYCYHLSASDINITSSVAYDSEIKIIVFHPTAYGKLMYNNTEISQFTMSQLKKKQITYRINPAEYGTNLKNIFYDSFQFAVKVVRETVESYRLHLYWSYVTVDNPRIVVNETDGAFNITVRRSGYLNQTSQVFCTKGSISASLCRNCSQLRIATFSPGQKVAYCCGFEIEDNNIAEGDSVKKYYVSLVNPVGAITTHENVTDVFISDFEDYPVIQFTGVSPSVNNTDCTHNITVKEGSVVNVMIERTGDSSKEVSVMCNADVRTASNSQDFWEGNKRRVTFAPGQTIAFYNVTILDDDMHEQKEYFLLRLNKPRMLAVKNSSASTLCVEIEKDERDRPFVFFDRPYMVVQEKENIIHVPINRTGNIDPAVTQWVAYRTKQGTADEKDFKPIPDNSVEFKSSQIVAHISVYILPNKERKDNRTFYLELIHKSDYQLKHPDIINITILNSHKVTTIGFTDAHITLNESSFNLSLHRTGYLDFSFTIRIKFMNPPYNTTIHLLSNTSTFPGGANYTSVRGFVFGNDKYNGPQTHEVCLVSSQNETEDYTILFFRQCMDVTIVDEEDYPTVQFEFANYTVQEPDHQKKCSILSVAVVRKNDIDYTNSSVRYFTTDNSAIANKHYAESRGVLHFDFGEDRKFISIEICTYIPANHNNRFYVHIEGYDISTKVATPSVAEVTILRKPIVPFFHKEPLVEMISSNLHYGTAGHKSLVCITSCDPLLSNKSDATAFCSEHGINNNLTIYEWEVSHKNGPFIPVNYSTFFASPHTQTLDKFYLMPGNRIRCKVTAVDVTGVAGYSILSQPFEISEEDDRLNCSNSGGVVAEFHWSSPFTGQPWDSIKLSGSVGAVGNTVPLLYSQRLQSALPLLTYFSARNNSCVLFTRLACHHEHAHVDSVVVTDCGWEFEVWMSLKELEENCNAKVNHTSKQTSVHLELELAYFYGNISNGIELEQHRSQLNISGIFTHESPPDERNVNYSKYDAGVIKLLDVSLEDILTVKFQSFANFTGHFLAEDGNDSSSVSTGSSNQNISLFLEETEQNIHNCTQIWMFCSTDVLFSGPYNVTLVPCVLPDSLTWSPSVMSYCVTKPPITFQLHIPTAKNVLPHFHNAKTELLLLKRAVNGSYCPEWRFALDDLVYMGIKIDDADDQNITVAMQKMVVCSTTGGYIPQYNSKGTLTGCLTNTHFITKLYTIMDTNNACNVTDDSFDARIISNIENVYIGWSFRTTPLFELQSDTLHWFIHVISSETHNANVIVKHDIRLIHLTAETLSPTSMDEVTTTLWCEVVLTVTIVLSVLVTVLLVLSLVCWKWSKKKDGCITMFGDCSKTKTDASTFSKIRRSHRYRAEIQELPHAFLAPNAIHASTEQCTQATNTNTATKTAAAAAVAASSSSVSNRLIGSKKYIVETTM